MLSRWQILKTSRPLRTRRTGEHACPRRAVRNPVRISAIDVNCNSRAALVINSQFNLRAPQVRLFITSSRWYLHGSSNIYKAEIGRRFLNLLGSMNDQGRSIIYSPRGGILLVWVGATPGLEGWHCLLIYTRYPSWCRLAPA